MVHIIDDVNHFSENIPPGLIFVCVSGSNWCGPCRIFEPMYEKLSEKYSNISFKKIELQTREDVSKLNGTVFEAIRGVPAVYVFVAGQILLAGRASVDFIEEAIKKYG